MPLGVCASAAYRIFNCFKLRQTNGLSTNQKVLYSKLEAERLTLGLRISLAASVADGSSALQESIQLTCELHDEKRLRAAAGTTGFPETVQ